MDSQTIVAIISAASGLAVATVGAVVKGAISQRAGTDEELRDVRTKRYPAIWRTTGEVSTWPKTDLTFTDLDKLHHSFRAWYYGLDENGDPMPGGLYLSENARKRYGEVQQLIELSLRARDTREDVSPEVYEDVRAACSAFRTALTEDLETRRKRAVWWVLAQRRRHRRQEVEAAARKRRAQARSANPTGAGTR